MVLTKSELIASLQGEVRILLHLAGKVDRAMLDYRPTPKQRSTLELLRYLSIMGPTFVRYTMSGSQDPNLWNDGVKAADARDFDQTVAVIAAQHDERLVGSQSVERGRESCRRPRLRSVGRGHRGTARRVRVAARGRLGRGFPRGSPCDGRRDDVSRYGARQLRVMRLRGVQDAAVPLSQGVRPRTARHDEPVVRDGCARSGVRRLTPCIHTGHFATTPTWTSSCSASASSRPTARVSGER